MPNFYGACYQMYALFHDSDYAQNSTVLWWTFPTLQTALTVFFCAFQSWLSNQVDGSRLNCPLPTDAVFLIFSDACRTFLFRGSMDASKIYAAQSAFIVCLIPSL